MKPMSLIAFSLIFITLNAFAQDNAELEQIFAEDQAARQSEDVDWKAVEQEDAIRRSRVVSLLSAGEVRTALDYYNAAMIFQHGATAEEIRLAHAFATISSTLEKSESSDWLKAASWDRLMLRLDQPQWYGTQYIRDDSGELSLYQVHPDAVNDEQRSEWSVPTLEEAQAKADAMNSNN